MNVQWKTYLILSLTLILGIILGVFSAHYCHNSGMAGIYKCHKGAVSGYSRGEICARKDCSGECPKLHGKEGGGYHQRGYHGDGPHGKKGACSKRGLHKEHYGIHGMPNLNADHLLKVMEKHLELTSEQIEKVEPILKGFVERLKNHLDDHKQEIMGIMDEMEPALAPILTEAQMKKLKKKMDKKRRMFDHRRERKEK